MRYPNGYNQNLHVQKEEFVKAVEESSSIKELCLRLGRSKHSVYTYAYRFGIKLKGRYTSGIRAQDGYYHYNNPKNHRVIVSRAAGRKLGRDEVVHHIDGQKTNNVIENLVLMDRAQHTIAHTSLERIAFEFVAEGLIVFDKSKGVYTRKSGGSDAPHQISQQAGHRHCLFHPKTRRQGRQEERISHGQAGQERTEDHGRKEVCETGEGRHSRREEGLPCREDAQEKGEVIGRSTGHRALAGDQQD